MEHESIETDMQPTCPDPLTRLMRALERPDPSSHHDLWGYFRDPVLTRWVVSSLAAPYVGRVSHVVGVETRGLGIGILVAQELGVPFVPVRKAGGYLPGELIQADSLPDWEGKRVVFEIQRHALPRGAQALVVDDWLTTGGQFSAVEKLVASAEGTIAGISVLVEEFEDVSELRWLAVDALMNWSDARGSFIPSRFTSSPDTKANESQRPISPFGDGFTLSELAAAIDRRSTAEYHDLWGIYRRPDLCQQVVRMMADELSGVPATHVVGMETRGLVLGPLVAQALNLPFVPIRKAGRYLPGRIVTGSTGPDWEGKVSRLEMQRDALGPGARALLVDDWCTTGSHVLAAQALLRKVDSSLVAVGVFADEFDGEIPSSFPRLVSFLNWEESRGTLVPSRFRPTHSVQ